MGCRDRTLIAIARDGAVRSPWSHCGTHDAVRAAQRYVIDALDVTLPLGDANMTSMAGDEDRGVRQTCKILMRQRQLGGGALT